MDLFARDRTFWRTVLFAAVIGTIAGAAALAFTTLVKAGAPRRAVRKGVSDER